jgi:arginine repressor
VLDKQKLEILPIVMVYCDITPSTISRLILKIKIIDRRLTSAEMLYSIDWRIVTDVQKEGKVFICSVKQRSSWIACS